MTRPWQHPWAGRLEERWIESRALAGNPLGDPARRPILVYLPPGYDAEPERRYPVVYQLQGLTGQVDMWRNRTAFEANVPELFDALFAAGEAPPTMVAFVDAWTSLGGSQFRDSPGTGRYHTYLCEEVVPWVDATYRTLVAREHRGVAGHSSGGYGAMLSAMLRPDLFGGLATHAGDALFEVSYLPDLREAARALRDAYDDDYERFWSDFRARPGRPRPSDGVLLNVYCMAACYSTDADGTVRLPFETSTGRLVPEVWDRWLACDPVRLAPMHAEALGSLGAIWIDAGRSDEYFLDLAAAAFRDEVLAAGADPAVMRFELYDGRHGRAAWRYPLALAHLAQRLSPSA